MPQVMRLKRSEKTYFSGINAIVRRINTEIKELNWLDMNIELVKQGKIRELKQLWVVER